MSDSDAKVIADLAAAGRPVMSSEGWGAFVVPDGYRLDTIDETPGGRRSSGAVAVHGAEAFVAAVEQRALDVPEPVVYVDEEAHQIVAVLNDDVGDTPGRRDYYVSLSLRPTPEWMAWKRENGAGLGQEAFAEMIEERVGQIANPPGAVMLELAQQIEGTTSADFSAGHRLQSGARQVMWKETVKATGGAGAIEIPDRFTLSLVLFFGAEETEVEAFLRYRIRQGHLEMSYKLVDVARIERRAFQSVLQDVTRDFRGPVISGPAPVRELA